MRTDNGGEFKNRWVKDFFRGQGVVIITSHRTSLILILPNDLYGLSKSWCIDISPIIEQSYKFTDVLQDIVKNYNGRPHGSLDGLSPSDINKSNEDVTWKKLYIDVLKPSVLKKKRTYHTRDPNLKWETMLDCRESRTLFQRDYEQKWTEEVFIVSRRFLRQRYGCTKLRIMMGTPSRGHFMRLRFNG